MRFVWAVAAFVLAAVLLGAGIAQRTLFQGPTTATTTVSVTEGSPFVLIDGAALNTYPGAQTLRAQGEGTIFAAYGRTADVRAWLADEEYTAVGVDGDAVVSSDITPTPAPTESAETAAPTDEEAAASAGRSPIGSDLWLDEFQQDDLLIAPLQLPADMSVLVATDGTAPAPANITLSWPIPNPTPWAGPLMVLGGIMLAVGVYLYFLAIQHVRRSRGPRRKGLPLPVTEPIDLAVEGADKGVISVGTPRRALGRGRRGFFVIPAVAVSALLFTGCSPDAWPQFGEDPSATPSPTETVIAPEGQQTPAVTRPQAERILTRIADTLVTADKDLDAKLLATRTAGAVLAARETNYALREEIDDFDAPTAIATKTLKVVLPQAYDLWPRTVMAVVDDASSNTASIMMMTQDDPWAEYKLVYTANLEAATQMPDLAPTYVGATQVQPDSPFLVLPPNELADAYADVLSKGSKSEYYDLFDDEADKFRQSVANDRKSRLADFNKTGKGTGSLTFTAAAGDQDPLALATVEGGAIVAVTIDEIDTVKPTVAGAVIKLDDTPTVKAITGETESATGFTTTFGDQMFFYVPAQGSTDKIRLLGVGSDILNAKVIKK